MSGKSIVFDDKKIEKSNFCKSDDIDVDKILVSKKEPYDTNKSIKYSIWYNDGDIKPLCIKLPHMIGYVKHFKSNKAMSFKVIDLKLLKSILKYGKESAV